MWEHGLSLIKKTVTPTQYDNFFKTLKFLDFDEAGRKLKLQAISRTHVQCLEESYLKILTDALLPLFGPPINLLYIVPQTATEEVEIQPVAVEEEPIPIATNLYPEYTFARFVEGEANKLARSVGMSISEHPRSTKFNPLFLYGPSGCGKTHLITAIGLEIVSRYPKKKVLYVGAREFQAQFVRAQIVDKNFPEFIGFYQQFDVLIVDDVQEWETSPKTSDAFFHIFNHLFMNNRRIILAADRTPAELKNMDERMISRFCCGAVAELGRPDHKLCIDILNAKIQRENLMIPKNVVEYIASHDNGSVRDLEGVINSLLAFSLMGSGTIDLPLAEKVCKQIKPEKTGKYDINTILDVVSEHYNIPVEELIGKTRKQEVVNARQVAMYLCDKMAHAKTTRIGRYIGGRDHSTVKHSIDKVVERIEKDKAFARDVKAIERKIKENR